MLIILVILVIAATLKSLGQFLPGALAARLRAAAGSRRQRWAPQRPQPKKVRAISR